MKRRGIRLTDNQARFILWLVVSLSVALALETVYLFYLKFEKFTAKVRVVEVPPIVLEVPKEERALEAPHESKSIRLFEFNYEKMILRSLEYLESDATVSIYTLDSMGVEKALGACESPYFLTEISTDLYSLLLTRDCTPISKIPQRVVYGIYMLAVDSEGFARAKMLDLREMGLPAFVVHFSKDDKEYYSTVIGAFPSPGVARSYLKRLDWDAILEKTGLRERGYVGCVINCGR